MYEELKTVLFDASGWKIENESGFVELFVDLKKRDYFGRDKKIVVKVSVEDYARADGCSRFIPNPARIRIGDYEMLLDC